MERSAADSPRRPLRVAAVQMESVAGDKDANLATIEAFVAQAAQEGVQLVVFPSAASPATGSFATYRPSSSTRSPSPFTTAEACGASSRLPNSTTWA